MKNICLICLLFFTMQAFGAQFPNKVDDLRLMNGGYLKYDLNSFVYDKKRDTYFINVVEELDPGGDIENIKCPYGEGYISHVISSTEYSPKRKIFEARYLGFICSLGQYEYENFKPSAFHYIYKGAYYDNNPSLIPYFSMDYFENLKKNMDEPNEYSEFVKFIKTLP